MTTLPHLSSPTTRATEQGRGQWIALLVRRWPTWLALSWAALTLADLEDGLELAVALLVASVGYLAITVIDRPGATWLVLAALLAAVVLLRVGGIDEWAVSIVAAALLAGVGLVRGPLRRPGLYAAQLPAAFVFGALALGALQAGPEVGRYLVAGGLLAHAAWDAAHWRAGLIVSRSFAEWCGALDLTLGLAILLLA